MSGDSVRGSLQSNYAELTENLELDAQIIARLQQDNLISRDCAQRIRKKETTMDKNEVLLDWALGHWDESFLAQFCDVLDQYSASQPRHKVLAEKIRTEFNKRAGKVLSDGVLGAEKESVPYLLLEGQLDATLQLRQLLDVLELFSAKWYDLGLRLGMKSYILDNIRKDERDLVKESCRAMFQKWLTKGRGTGDAKRTWRTVLKEVEFIYNAEFRQEVERELQKQLMT